MTKQLFWLMVWGVLFGYMEATIVVYLREIYYPEGFAFPLVTIYARIMLTEVLREAATLIIIWATVCLAYKRLQSRIAAFIVLFGRCNSGLFKKLMYFSFVAAFRYKFFGCHNGLYAIFLKQCPILGKGQ